MNGPSQDVSRFEEGLNPAQRAAVVHGNGPLLVLAGAGSGKTRVITHRIARLMALGVPSEAILAVTFTNKAAAEMHERVVAIVGARTARGLTVCTFHAFGLGFLQREARYLGFDGGFTIFDQSDVVGTLRELMRGMNIDGGRRLDAGAIAARISLAKNNFDTPETIPDGGDLDGDAAVYQQVAKLLYGRYQAALRSFHALDFDDLICAPVHLLAQFPELKERWQRKYRYILVDEYQDTNRAQLELLRLVAGGHHNLTVVGDDDQSIYGWRGADVTNILAFEEHFPGAVVVKLEQNYRSRAPVLKAANAVIGSMPGKKYVKTLFTSREGGDPLQMMAFSDPEVEAAWVAAEIERHLQAGVDASDIAIIYRSNKLAEAFEQSLRDRNIAHVVFGGQAFFDKKEVKDLLAYVRLAVAPTDEISLRRVINYPSRGIGEQALARLEAWAIAQDAPLFKAVRAAGDIPNMPPAAKAGCAALAEVIVDAKASLLRGKPASQVARDIAAAIRLKEDLQAGSPTGTAAEKRWGNVENMIRSIERWESRVEANAFELEAGRTPTLAEFLHRMTLRYAEAEAEAGSTVTLTTLHAAKGLEYRVVFLVGLEEGILPHSRTLDPKATDAIELKTDASGAVVPANDGIDEERRLFYVGITRAKERLYLCRCRTRPSRGQAAVRIPSRFLADVPAELCEVREVTELTRLSAAQMREKTVQAMNRFGAKPKF